MTGSCVLCGQLLKVVPDARGHSYTMGALGGEIRRHIEKKHMQEPQRAVPDNMMRCTVVQMIGAMGITIQALILLTYIKSDDADFLDQVRQMRELIERACASKEPEPVKSVIV